MFGLIWFLMVERDGFRDFLDLFFLRSVFCGLGDGSLLFLNFFLRFDFGILLFLFMVIFGL